MTSATNRSFESIIPPLQAYSSATYQNLFSTSSKWASSAYEYNRAHHWQFGSNTQILIKNLNTNLLLCDLACTLLGAIVITFLRQHFSKWLENVMVPRKLLTDKTFIRFMESFYVCLFTSISFTWALIMESKLGYLTHPEKLWIDFDIFAPIPGCVWWLYFLETSHYLHCIYAVIKINPWNKEDSIIMLVHHVFALLLLSVSYVTKTHYLGVLVIVLHDCCDIIMEGCKCCIKLTPQTKPFQKLNEAVKVGLFLSLLFTWFYSRLYLYPLKVIYPAAVYLSANRLSLWFPVDGLLFVLLWLILIMNCYWAALLIRILYNTIRGGHGEIEDIRDVEEMEEKAQKLQSNNKNSKKKKQ